MEERLAALEKSFANLTYENNQLKQDIETLKKKVTELEKNNHDYLTRITNLEKKEKYAQFQS